MFRKMVQPQKEGCRDSLESPNLYGKVLCLEMEKLCTNYYSSQTRGMDVECPYAERLSVFSIILNYVLNVLYLVLHMLLG